MKIVHTDHFFLLFVNFISPTAALSASRCVSAGVLVGVRQSFETNCGLVLSLLVKDLWLDVLFFPSFFLPLPTQNDLPIPSVQRAQSPSKSVMSFVCSEVSPFNRWRKLDVEEISCLKCS